MARSSLFKEGERVSGVVVIVWAATTNTDTTEGRGKEVDKSYHADMLDAKLAASGIGIMGNDGGVKSRTALQLNDDRLLLLERAEFIAVQPTDLEKRARLREQALKKLTPAERAAVLDD